MIFVYKMYIFWTLWWYLWCRVHIAVSGSWYILGKGIQIMHPSTHHAFPEMKLSVIAGIWSYYSWVELCVTKTVQVLQGPGYMYCGIKGMFIHSACIQLQELPACELLGIVMCGQ